VTDALADYAEEMAPTTAAPWRIGLAVTAQAGFWAGRTVVEMTKETCRRYVAWRGRSNGTARRELGVLRAAINHAHREGRLTRTVAVHLPAGAEPRDRWLTRAEVAALLRAALREPRVRLNLPLFILIAVYTGRREEAILSLRWAQVDLEAGIIDFRAPGAPISNKRRGRVRIPAKLLAYLKRGARKRDRARLCRQR
jgi:integrase